MCPWPRASVYLKRCGKDSMTELSVLIPALLGPLAELKDVQQPLPSCKILSHWLSRGQQLDGLPRGYLPMLTHLLALDSNLFAAKISAKADDIATDGYTLRADPVHFKAEMDHAVLLDQHRLGIYPEEAEKLVSAFNRHFAEDGLQLTYTDTRRWYLRFPAALDIQTTPLSQAIGRNVHNFLPQGNDARHWRKILNEAQMLFHGHDVNQRRESAGQLTINSLWLWGEGEPIKAASPPVFDWIMGDEVLACGLARYQRINMLPMQNDFSACQGRGLLVIDSLSAAASYGDVEAWMDEVKKLCEHWLKPLQQGLKEGQISSIKLYTDNGRGFEIHRRHRWKFWHRGDWRDLVEK